ncbi:MAG TPA: preprotein translocase subunit SecG [Verrucomicrobiae bacterium]|jgi:protein translocase SecG subunit
MIFIIGILTAALLLNCLLLIFLVLVQLPKKDAGAGLAFGGGAADALFGAGSGNTLTKITRNASIVLFVLALLLGYLEEKTHRSNTGAFTTAVQQKQSAGPSITAPPSTPPPGSQPPATPPPAMSTNSVLTMPLPVGTNSPAK